MAAAIAEQRQHRPNLGRDTLDQDRQTVGVGPVHLTEQVIADRTEIVLECVAARKHEGSPYAEDALQFSNERLTNGGSSVPGHLPVVAESEPAVAVIRLGARGVLIYA